MKLKRISIRIDVYKKLKNIKRPNESLSDLIERLIRSQKKDPLKYFGIGKDLPEEIQEEFEKAIIESKENKIS